jgi:hypothetical protein
MIWMKWVLSFGRKVSAELTLTGSVRASDLVRLKQQIDWLIEAMEDEPVDTIAAAVDLAELRPQLIEAGHKYADPQSLSATGEEPGR